MHCRQQNFNINRKMVLYSKLLCFVKRPAFKTAGLYTFSHFLTKGISFFLLFIYTNPAYISVDENGLISLMNSAVLLLSPFLALGTIQSASADYFRMQRNEFKDFFTTGFFAPILVMLLGMATMFVFKGRLSAAYGFPVAFIFVVPLMAFFSFCNELYVVIMRNSDDPVRYFKVAMWRILLEVGLSLLLVVVFALRWKGRVAGIMATNVFILTGAYFYFRQQGLLFGKIKIQYIKQELVYAVPVIAMQCSVFVLSASDKFFLSSFTNNAAVGIYGYACVFAAMVSFACSSVISFIMPKIYSCLSQPYVDYKLLKKYFLFYSGFCLMALIGVISTGPFLYKYLINEKYYSGLSYMFLIAIGYFFWNVGYFFISFLLYYKQKKKILLLSLLAVCISACSNYFFIKNFGERGAAVSTCAAYLAVLILILLFNYKTVRNIFFEKQTIQS